MFRIITLIVARSSVDETPIVTSAWSAQLMAFELLGDRQQGPLVHKIGFHGKALLKLRLVILP
jgi:hypothetical protein